MLSSRQGDGRTIAAVVRLYKGFEPRHALPVFRRFACWLIVFTAAPLYAGDLGAVRGVVHDAQHQPIAQAEVQLRSATSEWVQITHSDSQGTFAFSTVPIGNYVLSVSHSDFAPSAQAVTVSGVGEETVQ